MQECTLKLLINHELYDDFTDKLLAYQAQPAHPNQLTPLYFWGYAVQFHSQKLTHIEEQVSGFKSQMMIEVKTHSDQARHIHQYLMDSFPNKQYQASLYYSTKLT